MALYQNWSAIAPASAGARSTVHEA
jgi:hypothetical protein